MIQKYIFSQTWQTAVHCYCLSFVALFVHSDTLESAFQKQGCLFSQKEKKKNIYIQRPPFSPLALQKDTIPFQIVERFAFLGPIKEKLP